MYGVSERDDLSHESFRETLTWYHLEIRILGLEFPA